MWWGEKKKGYTSQKCDVDEEMRVVMMMMMGGGGGGGVLSRGMNRGDGGNQEWVEKSRHVKWNYASFINDGDTNKYEFIHTVSFLTDVKYKAFRQILGVCYIESIYIYIR